MLSISISDGPAANPKCHRVELVALACVESLKATLDASPDTAEAWWSPCLWKGDQRNSMAWEAACALVADVNFADEYGRHAMPSAALAQEFRDRAHELPGSLWHSTPRGFRVVAVLAAECGDFASWLLAAEQFEGRIGEWLLEQRLSANRGEAIPGYAVGHGWADLPMARYLYTPRALVSGLQRQAQVHLLHSDPFALDAFAPPTLVAVAPDKYSKGLPDPEAKPGFYEVLEIREALARTYRSDAHLVAYTVEGAGRQARINKAGLALFPGGRVTVNVFIADLDLPEHAEWTDEARAKAREQEANTPMLASCGVYDTSHGRRLVQPVSPAIPAAQVEAYLVRWLAELAEAGVGPDPSCKDWTRHFRLPNVVRDGKPFRSPYLNLDRMRTIALAPLKVPAPAPRAPSFTEGYTTTEKLTRALAYVAGTPPAVEGQHGDEHTYRLCAKLARGFDLSDSEVLSVLRDWNAGCSPPWSDEELAKKISNARRNGQEPIGGLLEKRTAAQAAKATRREEPPPPGDADVPPAELGEDDAPGSPDELAAAAPRPPPRLASVTPIRRGGDVPEIPITCNEEGVNDKAVAALAADPRVYQRCFALVQTLRAPQPARSKKNPDGTEEPQTTDALTINAIPQARLRELLATAAHWMKPDAQAVAKRKAANGTANEAIAKAEKLPLVRTHPPVWAIQAIHERRTWKGIRVLTGVTEWPRLRFDGTLLCDPGYDERTGYFYEPSGPVDPVPAEPTPAQVDAALALLKEAVCDFPFASAQGFSTWLAGLLTPLCLCAYEGPAPCFLADASTRGSGKSLLWELVSHILSGRPLASTPYCEDDDEMAKKITAIALEGATMVFLDNVRSNFGGGPLDQALTSRSWKNRVLGKSENTGELPLNCAWYATGNNLIFKGDIERRVCITRLEPVEERPEERSDFAHPELLVWARMNRHRLLAAALTLLRAYAVGGFAPPPGAKSWGTFEGWSRVVKGCIQWLGLPFPEAPTASTATTEEGEEHLAVIQAFERFDPERQGLMAADLLGHLESERLAASQGHRPCDPMVQSCIDLLGGGMKMNSKSLGRFLRSWRGRLRNGRGIRPKASKDRSGAIVWQVFGAAAGTAPAVGSDEPQGTLFQ